jgi:predicted Zn-dependent protease
MITNTMAQEWFDAAERAAREMGVREVEAIVSWGEESLTRFANNGIHQNVSEEGRGISVRVAEDGRTARVSTNVMTMEGVAEAARRAVTMARASAADETLLPMYGGQPVTPIERFDAKTAAMTPQERAEAVREAIGEIEGLGQTAAGIFSSGASASILMNSEGVFARHEETMAVFSVTATASDSSGWAKGSAVRGADLDTREMARRAAEKARVSAGPRVLEPGAYTVVLEPAAVLDFVGQIFGDCGGTALDEERSFLNGRMEERVFGENITIRDDVRHALQSGAPFDGEGVARQPLALFVNGAPRELAYSRAAAKKAGREATGHGFALPNESGEMPVNIVMEGGEGSVEDLVRRVKRGILVTRLWYIREVDPFQKVMTGMTRDGTFLVEDGEIVCGVRNFRFNESVVGLLQRVEAMSRPVRASGEEAFDMVVPGVLAHEFHFSEVTKF